MNNKKLVKRIVENNYQLEYSSIRIEFNLFSTNVSFIDSNGDVILERELDRIGRGETLALTNLKGIMEYEVEIL